MKLNPHSWLKITLPPALLTIALLLAGCVITSVHPFYAQKDLVFDQALLGKWTGTNADTPQDTYIEFKRDGSTGYLMTTVVPDEKPRTSVAKLFALDQQRYLDFLPTDDHELEFVPVHQLSKVLQVTPAKLVLASLKYGWLEDLLEKNPNALAHAIVAERDEHGKEPTRVVLTATTPELQAFIRKYATDPEAWDEPGELKRPNAPAQ